MARPLRIARPGGWYHITSRGNERRTIYRTERDRRHFLELLAGMVELFRVRLHAFVLMDNHYHLLIELSEANLSRAVQWLNVSYSVWFNRKHRRVGHLFQGRFKSVLVSPEEWALSLSRYIHLNPVRTGRLGLGKAERQRMRVGAAGAPEAEVVRRRIALLREHRWSSYRAYIGLAARPAWLECETILKLGGGKAAEQRANYRRYVEAAVREGLEQSPWEQLQEQVVLGGAEFLALVREAKGPTREEKAVERMAGQRPDFAAVIAAVEKVKGEKWTDFRDRHGDAGRDLALHLGRSHGGLKLAELGHATGVTSDASVAMCLKRYQRRLQSDVAEQQRCRQATALLNC
jgi:REP element-mobilizing transposase RayT